MIAEKGINLDLGLRCFCHFDFVHDDKSICRATKKPPKVPWFIVIVDGVCPVLRIPSERNCDMPKSVVEQLLIELSLLLAFSVAN